MSTCEELANTLEPKLKAYTNFKIGKTGQNIPERFNQEYSRDYQFYEVIESSPKASFPIVSPEPYQRNLEQCY